MIKDITKVNKFYSGNEIREKVIKFEPVSDRLFIWIYKYKTITEEVVPIKKSHRKDKWQHGECNKETKIRNKLRMKAVQTQNQGDTQA